MADIVLRAHREVMYSKGMPPNFFGGDIYGDLVLEGYVLYSDGRCDVVGIRPVITEEDARKMVAERASYSLTDQQFERMLLLLSEVYGTYRYSGGFDADVWSITACYEPSGPRQASIAPSGRDRVLSAIIGILRDKKSRVKKPDLAK